MDQAARLITDPPGRSYALWKLFCARRHAETMRRGSSKFKALRTFQGRSPDADRIAWTLLPQHGAIMLGKTLKRLIRHGRLTIIRPDGDTEQFGELTATEFGPDVAVRLKGALIGA